MDYRKEIIAFYHDHEKIIKIIIVATAIVIALAVFFFSNRKDEKLLIDGNSKPSLEKTLEKTDDESSHTERDEPDDSIYVDVDGAVMKPGVYKFKNGDRVFNAIEMAGGLQADADTINVNKAEELTDGQKLHIPGKMDVVEEINNGNASSGIVGNKIDINKADESQLQEIDGIGPAMAERIIEYRKANGRFKTIDDLKNVSGIGERKFENMKDKVRV